MLGWQHRGRRSPELRVIAISDTATGRSAARTLKNATLVYAATVNEAAESLGAGKVDALALSRDALATLAPRFPGARILDGRFHAAGVAGAVPRNRPAALGFLSAFIERAKASGNVKRGAGLGRPEARDGRTAGREVRDRRRKSERGIDEISGGKRTYGFGGPSRKCYICCENESIRAASRIGGSRGDA